LDEQRPRVYKIVTLHTVPHREGAMVADAWWVYNRIRYWYKTDPAALPFLVGIVGGFFVAFALIWLVFHGGVTEERFHLWITGCAASGLIAGVLIYQLLLPLGACWAWFGC